MYRVYCDNLLLYHDKLENLQIFNPSIELELNKTGSFEFKIYPDHPRYSMIKKLKSIVTVYQDDFLLFKGRVLEDETGFHNEKKIACEGELAFFNDSIQRPYDYTGTIEGFLNLMIDRRNEQTEEIKWFTLGNVTVTDSNNTIVRSSIDYTDTWTEIQNKLINTLGGYIFVRHEGYINYLDYLQDFTLLAPQKIKFGSNLLDLKRIQRPEEFGTVLIPLGAKLKDENGQDTDQRLTIAEVNNGLDYIVDEEAASEFGRIVKRHIWEDVTEAANLLTKGQNHIREITKMVDSIELTAADLATTDSSFQSFHLGTYVETDSPPHGLNQRFLAKRLSVKLFDPASNKLTLGGAFKPLMGVLSGFTDERKEMFNLIEATVKTANKAVYNVEQNLEASIQVTEDNIKASVADSYYLKDETEALVSAVKTELDLTKESFGIEFTDFKADIEAVAAGADAEFEEIRKYIRFIDGKILLGEVGNELELQIANDRISFLQDGEEVAYFSNHKLFVTDGEYTNSLRLGSFAFIPRANGNLSFKKI